MADRLIRLAIQAGVIAAVVAALPYKVFELDRYFVPKELVLHVAALIIALVLVARRRTLSFDIVDGLIAFFLLWSVASAVFATNHWVAQRSVAISVSSAIVFWGGTIGGCTWLLQADPHRRGDSRRNRGCAVSGAGVRPRDGVLQRQPRSLAVAGISLPTLP